MWPPDSSQNTQGISLPRFGSLEQIVLQVGIARDRPNVAEHFVQHARRAAGATLSTQPIQQVPGLFSQDTDDHFVVGKRGVVVRDLAQACGHAESMRWRLKKASYPAASPATFTCIQIRARP